MPWEYTVAWRTLGIALANRAMVDLDVEFAHLHRVEAERAIARLRGGWCHHPWEYCLRGRTIIGAGRVVSQGGEERLIRFDECGLCGWRTGFRVSHVSQHPAGAPPFPAEALRYLATVPDEAIEG